ncbi:hypothetical protein KIPB_010090 [Kipferlia bialata]|uniref:EF-hand domain-containing protein n=1 Tax=Kipferlia bialata TaxID=797122 RepID=A0A9K3GM34_9EUKA|nr:hypothetical protein KIPB_010090 [Kipferlia bialata]|eukprot:g10090.t1
MGDRSALWEQFTAIDADHSGNISAEELCKVFSTPAVPPNIPAYTMPPNIGRMLCRMVSSDNPHVEFKEFVTLDTFVREVQGVFLRFDRDKSGEMSFAELMPAIQQVGFTLQQGLVGSLMRAFDPSQSGALTYSGFLSLCAVLGLARTLFSSWDTNKSQTVTLSYDQLLCCLMWFM